MSEDLLKFTAFRSFVDSAFWHILAKYKLEIFKLNEGPYSIFGHYEHLFNVGSANKIIIGMESLEKPPFPHPNIFPLEGKLWTFNTIESFRNINALDFMTKFGNIYILPLIKDGTFKTSPECLCKFFILNYSDLKKFKFFYWFGFPAPVFPVNPVMKEDHQFLDDLLSPEEAAKFCITLANVDIKKMFFTIFFEENKLRIEDFSHFDIENKNCLLGFCDPSVNPSYPGWYLRSILFAICCTQIPPTEKRTIRILSYRHSYSVNMQDGKYTSVISVELVGIDLELADVKFYGWEKWQNEYKPRMTDLSTNMDPIKLTENAVDLNLKLMKWRLMPELDLDIISNTKCLLLGAGTLGCNVARQLLAWNVKNITLVDNGKVSYSNPVRQTLFTYQQSLNGGINKAEAAASSLKAIYPGVNATFVNLTIPMPGHPVSSSELDEVDNTCIKLSALVEKHDVIFLLLDTREARWLPSVLGYIHSKLVINSALGFDTYLVMRHGVAPEPGVSPSYNQSGGNHFSTDNIPGDQLGCYFCTDVVAPSNSVKDRSLDQQCTVTRPGVSMTAAALAVELMVTLLQHKDKSKASVSSKTDSFDFISCLGATPHQMRGYMACFSSISPVHRASVHCTACSQQVLDAYKDEGFDFLLKVFNDNDYLEIITGLSELKNTLDLNCVVALSDDDEVSS